MQTSQLLTFQQIGQATKLILIGQLNGEPKLIVKGGMLQQASIRYLLTPRLCHRRPRRQLEPKILIVSSEVRKVFAQRGGQTLEPRLFFV
jgi:hypothetical protein